MDDSKRQVVATTLFGVSIALFWCGSILANNRLLSHLERRFGQRSRELVPWHRDHRFLFYVLATLGTVSFCASDIVAMMMRISGGTPSSDASNALMIATYLSMVAQVIFVVLEGVATVQRLGLTATGTPVPSRRIDSVNNKTRRSANTHQEDGTSIPNASLVNNPSPSKISNIDGSGTSVSMPIRSNSHHHHHHTVEQQNNASSSSSQPQLPASGSASSPHQDSQNNYVASGVRGSDLISAGNTPAYAGLYSTRDQDMLGEDDESINSFYETGGHVSEHHPGGAGGAGYGTEGDYFGGTTRQTTATVDSNSNQQPRFTTTNATSTYSGVILSNANKQNGSDPRLQNTSLVMVGPLSSQQQGGGGGGDDGDALGSGVGFSEWCSSNRGLLSILFIVLYYVAGILIEWVHQQMTGRFVSVGSWSSSAMSLVFGLFCVWYSITSYTSFKVASEDLACRFFSIFAILSAFLICRAVLVFPPVQDKIGSTLLPALVYMCDSSSMIFLLIRVPKPPK